MGLSSEGIARLRTGKRCFFAVRSSRGPGNQLHHEESLPMLAAQSAEVALNPTIRAVSAKTLRQWCAPEVILVVTNLADETVILPHAIKQARQSRAKIVLAHVVPPQEYVSVGHKPLLPRPVSRIQQARSIVERMARQLRWLGFTCEPLVLTGHPHSEIPLIARNCCVDRIILSLDNDSDTGRPWMLTSPELLLQKFVVPVCVIGRHVSLASSSVLTTRNVTLAVSLDSDCDIPLAFASRFAQELRAKLTILHVLGGGNCDLDSAARAPMAVASRLPNQTWREAELFCPTEIMTREGEAAAEILRYGVSTNQDAIVLCSPGLSSPSSDWRTSVTARVLKEAQCPIFVLQKQLENTSNHDSAIEIPQEVSVELHA
jgi:nucleotide-binding universal stress UspA family protein